MQHPSSRARLGGLALVLLAALGCSSSGDKSDLVASSKSPWIQASPILRQQIQDEAARLPWTHGFERLEQIRWFASVGEPAYDTLLELAGDPRDDVAASALAALGATMDRRLVPYLRDLPWGPERNPDLRLERARSLVRLGDWSEIPTLIHGLSDDRVYTRSLCDEALREATHEDLGFDPRASEDKRQHAIDLWREWWLSRNGEGLLDG